MPAVNANAPVVKTNFPQAGDGDDENHVAAALPDSTCCDDIPGWCP